MFIIYNVWLNRKINNIEKKTKPEIYEKLFSTTLSSEFLEKNSAQLQYTNDLFKEIKNNIKDELVRIQNIQIYGGFTSNLNEYSKDFTILSSYIRLIVLQNKTENQAFPGEPLIIASIYWIILYKITLYVRFFANL